MLVNKSAIVHCLFMLVHSALMLTTVLTLRLINAVEFLVHGN